MIDQVDADREFAIWLKLICQEPDHWLAKRWRLDLFEQRPPPEFRLAFVTMKAAAEAAYGIHGRGPLNEWLGEIDRLVHTERKRQLGEDLEASGGMVEQAARPPDPEATYNGLTRARILEAKRAHDAEGHTSEAIHRRLGIEYRALLRARHKLGLVPWPEK